MTIRELIDPCLLACRLALKGLCDRGPGVGGGVGVAALVVG